MPITKDQLIAALEPYRDSDTVNPMDDFGNCIYEAPDGRHCLIGQVLVDLGVRISAIACIEVNPGAASLGVWADSGVGQLAESLQMNADGKGAQSVQPWKVAIERAFKCPAKYNG